MNTVKPKYTHVLWDWNGTLLDDVGAALKSVNQMLERRGRTPITMAQYYEYIGIPIRKFYENIFNLEQEDYAGILKEYNDGYENLRHETTLAKGAGDVLCHIHRSGLRQIVLSSCEQNQLNSYVAHYELQDYFDTVIGSQDFFAGSKVERAKRHLADNGIDPKRVLVVGDLVHDYEMAREIGADCVLIPNGHQSAQQLASNGAKVLDTIMQVPDELI